MTARIEGVRSNFLRMIMADKHGLIGTPALANGQHGMLYIPEIVFIFFAGFSAA